MPIYNQSTRDLMTTMVLGIQVDRASAIVPQTTNHALFTIAGGRIILTGILGEVTVTFGANACNIKLTSYPTVATAADTDLSTAVDLGTGCVVGDMVSITGTPGDNTLVSHKGSVQMMEYKGIMIQEGGIHLDCSTSVAAAAMKWSMWYTPLEKGAYVTAA